MAIIFEDGNVYDLSLEEKVSPSKGPFLKLPKKQQYHGYSDETGILYFFDGELKSPITRFHESINKQGHDTFSIKFDQLNKLLFGGSALVFRCSISIG